MCEIISCFSIFDCLPKCIKENIRCFFVTQKSQHKYGYCVTNKDNVYTVIKEREDFIDQNSDTETDNNLMHKIIPELCQKNIEEFFEGNGCMFARSKDNHIFHWGGSSLLFNQETASECMEFNRSDLIEDTSLSEVNYPAFIDGSLRVQPLYYFDDKNIIQISCGLLHCLALSCDGVLYGWKQLKSKNSSRVELLYLRENWVTFPKVIELNENLKNQIKSVLCFGYYSFVITISGHIYELTENGFNHNFDLNSLQQRVNDFEDKNPNKSLNQSFDRNNVIEVEIYATNFDKLPFIIFRNANYIYEYNEYRNEIYRSETDSETIFEYFLLKHKSTYRTALLEDNQLFVHKLVAINGISENNKLLKTSETIISNVKQFCKHFHQKTAQSFKLRKLFCVLNGLPKNIESNVKCYYFSVWWDSVKSCAFIVMSDSTVFGYGFDDCGKLGFGRTVLLDNYTRISELCGQNIEDFYEGNNCMFARNDKNQIFGWGSNQCGQLGRGFKCEENIFLKPQKIDYFDDKNIVQISCGEFHCLALSSDGLVYGWGQTEQNRDLNILTPVKIDLTKTIKYVHCYSLYPGYSSSALISTDGKVIVWGEFRGLTTEEYRTLISEIPSPVKKIMGYFILSECGSVYWLNIKEKKITRIETDIKFKDLYVKINYEINVWALQTDECVYEIIFMREQFFELRKTDYLNFYDFYLHKYKIIYKTIHITSDGFLITKDIKINQNYNKTIKQKLLQIEDKNVFDRKFEFQYKIISIKGKGAYGTVYEVQNKLNNKIFAIKRIKLKDQLAFHSTLREVKILSELKSDFVVKYINAWIEVKVIDGLFENYAYIQMQLCTQNLKEVINSLKNMSDERFKTIKYYISCELFRELTECVDYLHSLTPPIIHRDLKPQNVLISEGSGGRFLKLCDFGISKKYHEESMQTSNRGTWSYMAPEVRDSNSYNINADVFSLAMIATKIFCFGEKPRDIRNSNDLTRFLAKYVDTVLEHKFSKLLDLLRICLFSTEYNQRPDCKQILNRISEWTVDKTTVSTDKHLNVFFNEISDESIKRFIKTKLEN